MSVKSELATEYLQEQDKLHGHKQWAWNNIRAIVVGALKDGSIGREISDTLHHWSFVTKVWCPDIDVRFIRELIPDDPFNTLILSHGVTYLDWFEDMPWGKMKDVIDVNLLGTANVIQRFVHTTINTDERKKIIVIGSMAHRSVLNGSAVYCASKAGVAMLVRCLAWELAPKGYDVFCIHPSNTEGTPMTEETVQGLMRYRGLSDEAARAYWNDSPIRDKILQPEDIAQLVMYLLGNHGAYLSGAPLELGGGQR